VLVVVKIVPMRRPTQFKSQDQCGYSVMLCDDERRMNAQIKIVERNCRETEYM
jgi:hypothetical protein